MALFQHKDSKVEQIKIDLTQFKNEAALRDFFADNLEQLLGLRFLAKEYVTKDGRMDTLAIDETGTPVIIEYKWGEKDNILPQGLSYMSWLKDNKRLYDLLVADKLGKDVKVIWDSPRLILVAQGFDPYTLLAASQVKNTIELIKYTPYSSDILHLETVYGSEAIRVKSETPTRTVKNSQQEYSVEYHLSKTNQIVKEAFKEIQAEILKWANVEEDADQKVGITYRTTKSFVRFEFEKTYARILVRDSRYDVKIDPIKLLKDITSYAWGYKGMIKLNSKDDLNEILEIIRISYESTL